MACCSTKLAQFEQVPHLAVGMHRPPCCVPTIYNRPRSVGREDKVRFKALCATVLAAQQGPEWDGRWKLSDDERVNLFRLIDENSPQGREGREVGRLTLDELLAFARNPYMSTKVLETYPGSVHGLVNEDLVVPAFHEFDTDKNGWLSMEEWNCFLERLEEHRCKFLQRQAFLSGSSFFGRGGHPWQGALTGKKVVADDTDSDDERIGVHAAREIAQNLPGVASGAAKVQSRSLLDEKLDGTGHGSGLQCGLDPDLYDEDGKKTGCCCFPPGYWADYYYYSANNHPLHGIFACDPNHRLDRCERVLLEIATIGFCFWGTQLRDSWVVEKNAPFALLENEYMFSLLVVTIPSMIMWFTLFYLFSCPCGNYDASTDSPEVVHKARRTTLIGAIIGWIIVAGLAGVFILHMVRNVTDMYGCSGKIHDAACQAALEHHEQTLEIVLLGRLRSYFISWGLAFMLAFNPFMAYGSWSNPSHLGNYIGIGQWRIEKQRFKMKCHDISIKEAYGGYGTV